MKYVNTVEGVWISREVMHMPLVEIEREIKTLEALPTPNVSLIDVNRLNELKTARRKILGHD